MTVLEGRERFQVIKLGDWSGIRKHKRRAMDLPGGHGFYRQSTTGSDSTTECIEKVEAMISTAILHQEDVWNMLLSLFPENPDNNKLGGGHGVDGGALVRVAVQAHIPEAVKDTLEKAMDWSRLAQCRLKGLLTDNHPPPGRS